MSTNVKNLLRNLGPLLGLVLLFVILTALNPTFLNPSNLSNLLRQVSVNALISFGMTFVILTGGIDLSVGSLLALSTALMAGMIKSGMDPAMSMALCCLIGIALGAANGLIITYGKVAPFIATLATMTIFRGATLVYSDGRPISGLTSHPFFTAFGIGDVFGVPVPAITTLLMFALCWFILNKTTRGRKTYAVGGSEKVSYIAGIHISRVKIFAYAITGLLTALAGIIITSRLNSAQPTAGTGYELDAIAAVVLGGTSLAGGKGRITGSLIGALIIATLTNGLNILNVSSFYQQVVKGGVILLAVLMDRKK